MMRYTNTETHAKAWNASQHFIATQARQQGQYHQKNGLQHRTQLKRRQLVSQGNNHTLVQDIVAIHAAIQIPDYSIVFIEEMLGPSADGQQPQPAVAVPGKILKCLGETSSTKLTTVKKEQHTDIANQGSNKQWTAPPANDLPIAGRPDEDNAHHKGNQVSTVVEIVTDEIIAWRIALKE